MNLLAHVPPIDVEMLKRIQELEPIEKPAGAEPSMRTCSRSRAAVLPGTAALRQMLYLNSNLMRSSAPKTTPRVVVAVGSSGPVIRTGELRTRSAADPSVDYGSVGGLRWLKQIQDFDAIEKLDHDAGPVGGLLFGDGPGSGSLTVK
jgi:hypothetical protein